MQTDFHAEESCANKQEEILKTRPEAIRFHLGACRLRTHPSRSEETTDSIAQGKQNIV